MTLRSLLVIVSLFAFSGYAAETTPGPAEIVAKVHKEHPRLLESAAGFEQLRSVVAKNPHAAQWAAVVHAEADSLLKAAPSKYEIPDGKRLLATSRRVCERTLTLGLVYRLSGDQRYAERLWQELDAAAQFKDWNPSHFLDTAEMTAAFALGYDWLYDYWTPERRAALKTAIVEKGLNASLPLYRKNKGWVKAEHNWNQVCNGGMTMGALAIAQDEPALAGEILAAAIGSVPRAMKHFAPDGAWGEGPGYWDYATRFNVFMIASLDSATGSDFGLSQIEGFSRAGEFPIQVTGPIGRTFNYADAGDKGTGGAQLLWFAERFKAPGVAAWRLAKIDRNPTALDLIWGARWLERDPKIGTLPLAKYFRGAEVVTMRSAWDDPDATFVGFKGGDNQVNHGHLDLGSFVLDAMGQRWALDLGADDYNLPGYFGRNRWEYYRCRAEGHNTLVLNPGNQPDQDVKAKAPITQFQSREGSGSAVTDLTAAYASSASSVLRGVRLLGRKVIVQDEVKTEMPVELYWFMHTDAEVATDGGSAILSKGGKKLTARILQPKNATFEVLPAQPLPGSPHPPRQQVKGPGSEHDSTGVRKLAIKVGRVTSSAIVVEFAPEGEPIAESPIVPLAQWPAK